jgi:predicted nucleic acid-binding protein
LTKVAGDCRRCLHGTGTGLDEGATREIERALDIVAEDGASTPGNFQSEIAHGLLQAERHGRIDSGRAARALAELLALPILTESPDPQAVLTVARHYQLTAYDATYLALATQLQMRLATLDKALGKLRDQRNYCGFPEVYDLQVLV